MKRAFIIVLSGFLVLTAFQKKVAKSQDELMQEYIDEKLAVLRSEEWLKCKAQVILDAEIYVDSIIYQQVNFNIGDSLKAPGKPVKPMKPYDTLRLDSTPIVPILDDSLPR